MITDLQTLAANFQSAAFGRLDVFTATVRKHLVVLLVTTYCIAIAVPYPGVWLRSIAVVSPRGNQIISMSHILLAVLLMSAGATIDSRGAKDTPIVSARFAFYLLVAWTIPLVSVLFWAHLLKRFVNVPSDVFLGLALVAAMPIANSTVAWSHLSRGSVKLSLALLVASTLTAPLIGPLVMQVVLQNTTCLRLRNDLLDWFYAGIFLVVWVVAPALAGIAIARTFQPANSARALFKLSSTIILLLLNYINAASFLPALIENQPLLLIALLSATCTCCATKLGGRLLTMLVKESAANAISLRLGTSMKNTGAALVLCGAVLHQHPAAVVTVILYTLVQNLLASLTNAESLFRPATHDAKDRAESAITI